MNPTQLEFDALILAGGRGSRMGGADKASLELNGERLVDRVIAAVREVGARRVVVAGPATAGLAADVVVREEPAHAGPLAGIAAGLPELDSTWVLVLACDLQYPTRIVRALLRAAQGGPWHDGIILVDEDSREQWLAGLYRRQALIESTQRLGDGIIDAPVRRALKELKLMRAPISNNDGGDIDTPEALVQARKDLLETPKEQGN